MKLLFINYMALPIPPVKGGAVEYLVDAFLKDNEKTHNHDIVVYSIYNAQAYKAAKKYKYTKFRFVKIDSMRDKINRIIRHLINLIPYIYIGNTYIAKILKNENCLDTYDAIIIENAPEFGLIFPKCYRNKLILHLHNDYLNKATKNANRIYDCYSNIFTISNTLAEYVKTVKISDKIKTLYNGVELSKFSKNIYADQRTSLRTEYNINKDDFVFMYCGRVVEEKGVIELCNAFLNLKEKNIRLLIVGGCRYGENVQSDYMKRIAELNSDRIIMTGYVPYCDIAKYYALSDVGVIPSIINDAFNLTAIEFCACGLPVIVSDKGAMKELVNDKCAIIVKCNDNFVNNIENALKYMLEHRNHMDKMGKEAIRVAQNFSIEKYCNRFNSLLLDIRGDINED